jgi:predicted ATP-binding protein involved in virulence
LEAFLPDFSDFSVKRNHLRMVVNKAGEELRVNQLSDGEKCLIAMIGDLARRLAIANPTQKDPVGGEGIVLIDEIDLHLHPSWQRMVVPKLIDVFPNCQFVVSTHSPQVLGEIEGQHIRCLYPDQEKGLCACIPDQALGLDSSEVLAELMQTRVRDEGVTQELEEVFQLIDNEHFSDAKEKIKRLEDRLNGSIPELVRANALITMLETPLASEGPGQDVGQ